MSEREFDFELPGDIDDKLDEMATSDAATRFAGLCGFFYRTLIEYDVPQTEVSRMARAFIKGVLKGMSTNEKS